MTRRGALNGACSIMRMPWSIAPLIEVPPPNNCRGACSTVAAKARADASSASRVHCAA